MGGGEGGAWGGSQAGRPCAQGCASACLMQRHEAAVRAHPARQLLQLRLPALAPLRLLQRAAVANGGGRHREEGHAGARHVARLQAGGSSGGSVGGMATRCAEPCRSGQPLISRVHAAAERQRQASTHLHHDQRLPLLLHEARQLAQVIAAKVVAAQQALDGAERPARLVGPLAEELCGGGRRAESR